MIREYQENDLEAILSIWLNASTLAHDFIPAEYWKSKIEDMRNLYIPMSRTFVYEKDSTILGFVSLADNFIAAIFIAPNLQGQGIGTQLINYVKTLHATLYLGVFTENHNAIAFYQKHGFIVLEEKDEENTGHREYIMQYTK